MRRNFFILISSLLFLLSTWPASADHSTLRNDTFGALPDANSAAFRTNSQIMWDHEEALREGRHFTPFVYSGGLHATSVSLTSPSFSAEAFVPERISQTSSAITYVAVANDVCWTIISADNNGITGWTRVGTTSYYFKCQGNTTPAQPDLPPNSAWLMGPIIVTASALTSITDMRSLRLTGAQTISSSITVSNTAHWIVEPGATLTIANGVTVTMIGSLAAPCKSGQPWIILQGTGKLLFTAGAPVCPEWWGAYTDGTHATETTTAINQAFVGSTQIHFSIGTYLVEEVENNRAIWVGQDNTTITGNGAASIITIATNSGTPFCVSKVSTCLILPATTISNIRISNIRIRGTGSYANSALYGGRGIMVNGYDHVTVDNITVDDMSMIGIAFHPGTAANGAYGAIVTNSQFTQDFYSGININGRAIAGIISNNTIRNTTGAIDSVALQVTGQSVVSHNTIYNSAGYGIFWGEGAYYGLGLIEGNFVSRTTGPCILAQYHGPVKILGNTLAMCGGTGGIVVAGGTLGALTVPNENNVVANNTILQAYTYGIYVSASNTIIANNNITWKAAYTNNTATTTNLDYLVVGPRCEAGVFIAVTRTIYSGNLIENCSYGFFISSTVDPIFVTMSGNSVLSAVVTEMAWVTGAGALITGINLVHTSPSGMWENTATGTPTPPNVPWMRGAKIWKSDPVASGVEGIINVVYIGTTLSVSVGAAATSFDVPSTANMLTGDLLIIYRDDASGSVWQTTILTIIDADTFTTAAGIPWATGNGSTMIVQRWKTFGSIAP